MRPDPQFLADLVTFTEEILDRKTRFLCSDCNYLSVVQFVYSRFCIIVTTYLADCNVAITSYYVAILYFCNLLPFSTATFIWLSCSATTYLGCLAVLKLNLL